MGRGVARSAGLRLLGAVMPFDLRAGRVDVTARVTFEVAALNTPTARRGCSVSVEQPLIAEFRASG